MTTAALFTDLYELTMLAGYLAAGCAEEQATFDLYFRNPPAGVDLVVAAGLDPVLDYLEALSFDDEDLAYLSSLSLFDDTFLTYLGQLAFRGDVWAVPEGLPVFSDEPLLRVSATLAEAQLVETYLLNRICYSSLVASNAAQLTRAARGKPVLEFGARRAHGPDGAMTGARAAMIGGCTATSNVAAGQRFDVAVSGTQAHAFVMAFASELAAFRAYAATFPDASILLVDTYDTLGSGVPNAITVANELAAGGHAMKGVRLDSGDLASLSRETRRLLDAAGLPDVQIIASGDLDAERVRELEQLNVPIDGYGVGTSLLTARRDPALSGVYKLAEIAGGPVMKLSGSPAKATSPGRKQVWRGEAGDVIGLHDEQLEGEPLLVEAMRGGQRMLPPADLAQLARRSQEAVAAIHPRVVTGEWSVRSSQRLAALRAATMQRLRHDLAH
ncbi:MAG: nicotinate phosphoribosyltransferase [Actinomycetota bacterium]|jgi:nicotinate phosphoribosyltransferase|nr:nicotinate phosphoribosyltransferase [Euzebyaceae bacterium]MDQ3452065.1 nicotinate phosphoribosyltransferase [Actinomycetota bacterium]